ncbi:hypothetical protein ACC706_36195, partial [Rhizobium johnstonii]
MENPSQRIATQAIRRGYSIAGQRFITTWMPTAYGHAAQMIVFQTIMSPGENFIAARQLYGGSVNQ